MKEGIVNVKLKEGPMLVSSCSNKATNSCQFNYWREGYLVIYTKFLCITLSKQASFVTLKSTISFKFDFEDLFGAYGLFARRKNNKDPSVIGLQRLKF